MLRSTPGDLARLCDPAMAGRGFQLVPAAPKPPSRKRKINETRSHMAYTPLPAEALQRLRASLAGDDAGPADPGPGASNGAPKRKGKGRRKKNRQQQRQQAMRP